MVVAAHGVGRLGTAASALVQHFVLQTAGGDDNVGTLGVLGEETLACALGFRACGLGGGTLLLFQTGEEVVQQIGGFVHADLRGVAFQHIVDGGGIVGDSEAVAQTHFFQLVADVQAQCVA